ncbi:ABC transporter ATP-binding protein [Paenibacillus sp. MMS18-CY102]|uniref:ABC transporter ATP-binding protein n=1 Tax=Paenibacillus sp. MMS18-CY102 TaxID=2682849 RepID=UPI001365579D|nr:ABC transporter ATP-binding protein [Paenibacillus sp. MMS18-CY102]MWC29629.1 ATP-binding cassette domain-containing protein [Paenibacillus sp. MMS18-CY102]
MAQLLEVDRLRIAFRTAQGAAVAVDEVSFAIGHGETVALVGESGCGKSVTSLSIMGLLGQGGSVIHGETRYDGHAITRYGEAQMRRLRGKEVAMIFQEPMTSLNPVMKIGEQIGESVRLHRQCSRKEAKAITVELLKKVGIARAEAVAMDYPHALSGGMRQRVMIAMAMAGQPKLLIADEPTTALDVTIQAQILELMKRMQEDSGMAILLVTHDLGVVAEMADQVIVMYAGQVVEAADVYTLFRDPRHPYTRGLLQAIPRIDGLAGQRAQAIPGAVPAPQEMPEGCRFHPRCREATEQCRVAKPGLLNIGGNHSVRCWINASSTSHVAEEPRELQDSFA